MQTTIYMNRGGRIECLEHAPCPGTDTWVWGQWRPITKREATEFERDISSPPACETCRAIARRKLAELANR
jgi:hypothetical protein